jgi:hypothetical protein
LEVSLDCNGLIYIWEIFRNRQETQDKYGLRGAEWVLGDCSAEAMSIENKEKFILALKEKVGVK